MRVMYFLKAEIIPNFILKFLQSELRGKDTREIKKWRDKRGRRVRKFENRYTYL